MEQSQSWVSQCWTATGVHRAAHESCAKGEAGLVRHSAAERKNSVACRVGRTRRVRAKNESLEVVGLAPQGIEGISEREQISAGNELPTLSNQLGDKRLVL